MRFSVDQNSRTCSSGFRAVGTLIGKRVAYIASSSWSHAPLNDKDRHLRPDTTADQSLYDAMVRGDDDAWLR